MKKLVMGTIGLIMVSAAMADSSYNSYNDFEYNIVENSGRVFECGKNFLKSNDEKESNFGAYILVEMLKKNVVKESPDELSHLLQTCQNGVDNETHPRVSDYYEYLEKSLLQIKNNYGICWSNEYSLNVSVILSIGGGLSRAECFVNDGTRYTDSGLFGEAGLGLGVHIGIFSEDYFMYERDKKSDYGYYSAGIGAVIDSDDNKEFLSRVKGVSLGAGVSRVKSIHTKGKIKEIAPDYSRAAQTLYYQSIISDYIARGKPILKPQP